MSYVIYNPATKQYKRATGYYGGWTSDLQKARVYKNAGAASHSVGNTKGQPVKFLKVKIVIDDE